jgi:hypothetical protein
MAQIRKKKAFRIIRGSPEDDDEEEHFVPIFNYNSGRLSKVCRSTTKAYPVRNRPRFKITYN